MEETAQENADGTPPEGVGGSKAELPLGTYPVKIDDKGRIKVPARFQEYIEGFADKTLFVTSLDRRKVAIYNVGVWRENLKRFKEYRGDPAAVAVVQFNANDLGTEEKMDGQGRLLLNSSLREALVLEDRATLHMQGCNGHIECITDSVYQELRARALREAAMAAEKLLGEGFD